QFLLAVGVEAGLAGARFGGLVGAAGAQPLERVPGGLGDRAATQAGALGGGHSGSSDHGVTPCSTSHSSSTQVTSGLVPAAAAAAASIPPNVTCPAGPVATYAAVVRARATSTAQAPRSR